MKDVILAMSLISALTAGGVTQPTPAKALPLDNLGLEHLDIVVPAPAASARFYSRVFASALHQQPVRDSLRYFISLEKSLPYYRLVYGPAAERPRDANGRVTFQLAADTRLVLEEAPSGQAAAIAHYTLKVAPFDRAALIARLRDLGARVLDAADEPDVVRFADNNGIIVEVRVA